ncbi:MAG: tannase/feruloyl esterase family alpha/beta hydrolase [Acidobacteriota bacterium]
MHTVNACQRAKLVVGMLALGFLSVAARAQTQTTATAFADLPVVQPTMDCPALKFMGHKISVIAGVPMQVQSAQVVDEEPAPYCMVKGYVTPSVGFEVRLPTTRWTQRYLQLGCGALCGATKIGGFTNPLVAQQNPMYQRGELVLAATDTGHSPGSLFDGTWAAGDPQLRIDFAYRGVHVTSIAAKAIMQAYYGQKPKFSYFVGCSEGGREAAMESQRYPEDFNGIISGSPAINFLTQNTFYHAWNARANADVNGHLVITPDKLPILHAAALAACDVQDGLHDSIISEPDSCHYDPVVTQCRPGQDPATCLSAAQVQAARLIYQGARDEKGNQLVIRGPLPGSELQWNEYVTIPLGGSETISTYLSTFVSKYMACSQIRPIEYTLADFRFDEATFAQLADMHTIYDALDPNLSDFEAAGSKLILWHSLGDGSISAVNTVAYYKEVEKLMGADRTRKFALLYLFPGGNHCNSGRTPIVADLFSALARWVERNVVPSRVTSYYFAPNTVNPGGPADMSKVVRTRPVFPYPQVARYSGSGSIDDAANFEAGTRLTPEEPINWIGTSSFFKPDYQQWCGWSGMSFTCGPDRRID